MLPLSKVVDADDFAAPELVPYVEEILCMGAERFARVSEAGGAALWRAAMTLRALVCADVARSGAVVACLGAGADPLLFALASRGVRVYAVDRYLERTEASLSPAPAGMLDRPERYATSALPRGHVIALHSQATRVNLPRESVDAVVCAGLDRLGSTSDIAVAVREIARILRTSCIAVITTMFRIDGPGDRGSFDDRYTLFTAPLFDELVVNPSGLMLRDPITTLQSAHTFEARHVFADFDCADGLDATLMRRHALTSDLVLYHEGFLFGPAVITLHKTSSVVSTEDAARPAA